MRFYISGPISGTVDYKQRFREAAERLRMIGIDYVNPTGLASTLPEGTHEEYLSVCLRLLSKCDALLLLPGAEDSEGCKSEWLEAKRLDLPIYYDACAPLPKYEDATTL